MRAILIDPFKREVSEIDIDPSLDNLYATLGVEVITVLRWSAKDALILDDEGLLKPREEMEYWWMKGAGQPFAGRGLILGDEYGENRPASSTLAEVRDMVKFVDREKVHPDEYIGWTIISF
jgi:hypothetical protein